jgi:FkbM family methyltransferase
VKPRFRTWRERLYRLTCQKSVSLDGARFYAIGDGIPAEVTRLLRRGNYEFAERKLLLSILQADDRVLEVGAGIGVLGLIAARVCGARNVLSYEPNPKTIPLIKANHTLNNLYPGVREKAITAEGGSITFFRTENIISSSLIECDLSEAITVGSDRINDAIAEFRPTVLVMDVEGAEVDLLPAADLSTLRALVIETHAKITGVASVADLKVQLVDRGFRIAEVANNNLLCLRMV